MASNRLYGTLKTQQKKKITKVSIKLSTFPIMQYYQLLWDIDIKNTRILIDKYFSGISNGNNTHLSPRYQRASY